MPIKLNQNLAKKDQNYSHKQTQFKTYWPNAAVTKLLLHLKYLQSSDAWLGFGVSCAVCDLSLSNLKLNIFANSQGNLPAACSLDSIKNEC